jgi:hypothetical protein
MLWLQHALNNKTIKTLATLLIIVYLAPAAINQFNARISGRVANG